MIQTADFQFYEFGLPPPGVVGRIYCDSGSEVVSKDTIFRPAFEVHYPDVYVLAVWQQADRCLTLVDRVQSRRFQVRIGDRLIYTPTRPAKGSGSIELSLSAPFSMLCSGVFCAEPHSPASEIWMKRHLNAIASMTGLDVFLHPGYTDC